ncbi:hypothetical protein HQ637_11670 [Enterococcus faecium]|nr:hypothetical protein [Enterococcus faecium]
MGYYIYKINLQHSILRKYSNDYEYLLENEIPKALGSVLSVEKLKELDFYKLSSEGDLNALFYSNFNELDIKTQELIKAYKMVLNNYKENRQILYSKEFLELNEECMQKRNFIQKKFPELTRAFEVVSDRTIEKNYQIELVSQVGTGIQHIKKFLKMKYYLDHYDNNSIINPLNLTAYYSFTKEQLFIEKDSKEEAQMYINNLQKILNTSNVSREVIGFVNINPVYEKIKVENNINKISYTVVYPNGKASGDRHRALLELSNAKEQTSIFVAEDDGSLKMDDILEELNSQAQQGYLKEVESPNIVSIIKFVENIFERKE